MNNSIEALIRQIGPCLSSRIVDELVNQGMKPDAARKRVSRASGAVCRLKGVNFPNRESFLFLDGQFGTPEFHEKLSFALTVTNSCYGRALIGMAARGGVMSAVHFPVASGLAVEPARGQVAHALVEQKLINLGLIRKTGENGEDLSLWSHSSVNKRRQSTIIVEDTTLESLIFKF